MFIVKDSERAMTENGQDMRQINMALGCPLFENESELGNPIALR